MVRKIVLGLLVAAVLFLAFRVYYTKSDLQSKNTAEVVDASPAPTSAIKNSAQKTSIFVPYWNIDVVGDYDRYLYFGVSATKTGIDRQDPGFANLSQFTPNGRQAYLTLRMLDNETNLAILKDSSAQDKIITEVLDIAQNSNFSGIVLDLELFSLFDDKIPGQINGFVEKLYKQSQGRNIKLALAIYGDVFYRKRPFDVPSLSKNSDEIMVMAYDFHKSRGEPGPNFPSGGKEKWGYDFKTMISDFVKDVPTDKLTVVFGMFGYEWTVDEQGRPLKAATAKTRAQIHQFTEGCSNCKVTRDDNSQETYIEYTDANNRKRIIWYEDEDSVKVKRALLERSGIGSISYWVAGYF